MNTAARDRALLHTVTEYFKDSDNGRRTPISKLALSKERDGSLKVALHTSRPNRVRIESQALTQALKDRIGVERPVTVQVVPEARAVAKFVRTSPRKARLVIDVIKGKRVAEAIAMLRFIPNHAAELISKVLLSAAANAQDGWGAGVEELKVVNILADGGPTLKRVRPRAQGRAFRILKRTTHLTVILAQALPATRPARATTPTNPKTTKALVAPILENVQAATQNLSAPGVETLSRPALDVAYDLRPMQAPRPSSYRFPVVRVVKEGEAPMQVGLNPLFRTSEESQLLLVRASLAWSATNASSNSTGGR